MLKSIWLSSVVISHVFVGAHFEYPEVGESWAQVDVLGEGEPNYCGSSYTHQSPININTNTGGFQSCPSSDSLSFSPNTAIKTFKVKNTGHNLQIIPVCCGISNEDSNDGTSHEENGSIDSDDEPEAANVESGTNFGVLKDNFGYIGDDDFCLDSFHIHWGQTDTTGSEHRMDNQQSKMEMHFVHYKCGYKTVAAALDAFDNGLTSNLTLAVVAVMYDEGADNPFIGEIVSRIKLLESPEHSVEFNSTHDMFDVVPLNNGQIMGNYYHYKGSLTTPPCTPAVSWHVLENKMTIGSSQLAAIRTVLNDKNTIGENYRNAKTNSNPVYKCSASSGSIDDDDNDNEED